MKKVLCLVMLMALSPVLKAIGKEDRFKLPYFTVVIPDNTGYLLYFANPIHKPMDCFVHPENIKYPVMLPMGPKKVSEPLVVKGIKTKFNYFCKEAQRA